MSGWPSCARNRSSRSVCDEPECSDPNYDISAPPAAPNPKTIASGGINFWFNRTSAAPTDNAPWADKVLCQNGTRVSDDIILTDVIGFDVKAFDTTTTPNTYVDLSISGGTGLGAIANPNSGVGNGVYDTWSTTYFGTTWNDGLDDGGASGNGIVDDDLEKLHPPPYAIPLRGIQVKIRAFEPDSKQVREVTVEQNFLPQ